MTERQFAPGAVIYREGERSDFAYFIKSGRVEILKSDPEGPRQVTVLSEGDVFGEMGVVLDQPRSVTARCLGPVTVRTVSRANFLQAINQQSETARPVLKTLLARLHEDEAQPASKRAATASAQESRLSTEPKLRLLPGSERLKALLQPEGIDIARLPFRVGRKTVNGENAPAEENDLTIEDSEPFNLSRRHFIVEREGQSLVIRDLGSHLGTQVNGMRIGGAESAQVAPLRSGSNEIVAGSDKSPYRFRLELLSD